MTIAKGSRIIVQDEGVTQGVVGTLNFTGAGVTASVSGNTATMNVTGGGGGSFAISQVEVDVGSTLVWRGRFTITDAGISPASRIMIYQAPGPYTGKGALGDEAEMDPIVAWAVAGSGSALAYWQTIAGISPMMDVQIFERTNAVVATTSLELRRPYDVRMRRVRRGLVRGNIKFNYVIG